MKDTNEMQLQGAASQPESLGEKIEQMIETFPPQEVTLVNIMDIVGVDSLFLLTVFLSLIFLVPVSIPGVSTVFGSAILLIGITNLFSRKIWLPEKIAHRKLSSDKLREGFKRALVWVRRFEKICQPHRMKALTTAGGMTTLNHLSFILAAVLLMAPFGFIPFSNTLPALALIFLSMGMMEQDGGFILLGNLSNIATIIYFAFLIAGGGWSLMEFIKILG